MLTTAPLARFALVLVLTAFMAALMVVRLDSGERQEPTGATITPTPASFERHAPGSAAHGRRVHRLGLAATVAVASSPG